MNKVFFYLAIIGMTTVSCNNVQSYHEDDKEGLRIFLRQPSSDEDCKINATQVGMEINDTINWQHNEQWVEKIEGLVWNNELPKRLIAIEWPSGTLEGTLDARLWRDLEEIECSSNLFTAINVNENKKLKKINCSNNQLSALDLRSNTALEELWCEGNQLSSLNIQSNTLLSTISCINNQLTELDIHANTALRYLYCEFNQLTSLDVRYNTLLTSLYCYNNQLTELDVHENMALASLYCHFNRLKKLDVRMNTALEYLYCNDNQLSKLDVCEENVLKILKVYNNNFSLSDLFALKEIIALYEEPMGLQILPPLKVKINDVIDFSNQNKFNDTYTQFTITQNNNATSENDYNIYNGKITFYRLGNYTITMTNEAIAPSAYLPAKVIIEIEVEGL